MDLWASIRLSVWRLSTPKSLGAISATNRKKPLIIIWKRFRQSTIAIWTHISTQARSILTWLRMEPYPTSFQRRNLRGRSITSWATTSFKVSASAVKYKAKIFPTSSHHLYILRATAKDITGNKVTATSNILLLTSREETTSQSWTSNISTKMEVF